jgi:hypothetical protein
METSTRIIDYHLKKRIEGQNSKITLSGRSLFFPNPAGQKRHVKASTYKSSLNDNILG